ncbi:MAG: J domain-containing protein [Hyphomonadaceae bacterium]
MLPAFLVLALTFALLFLARLGGARRRLLQARWPAVLFAGAALILGMRGSIVPALWSGLLGALSWVVWPRIAAWRAQSPAAAPDDSADAAARSVLGVGPQASETEIRSAYRSKMAQAHPDRGGSHQEAARLTAARDRLLSRRRGG